MKKYLYQGWAGNTHSHKCTGDDKLLYYKIDGGFEGGGDILMYSAGVKIPDITQGRFEFIPPALGGTSSKIAPNFNPQTDSYCFAWLPVNFIVVNDNESTSVSCQSLEELLSLQDKEMPSNITRITAREYYNTNLYGNAKTFRIMAWDGDKDVPYTFTYKEGMTFNDWFYSEYNTIPFLRSGSAQMTDDAVMWTAEDVELWGDYIFGFSLISDNQNYSYCKWNDKIVSMDYGVGIIG